MVTEIAYLVIDPQQAAAFEAAVEQAAPAFRSAEGCRSMRLERVIETAGHYRLVVGWDSVEAHMVTFRESDAFQLWRSLAGPFFAEPPRVEHWQVAATHF